MTPERLAELDAVMVKATQGPWVAKMWDSPYKIGIWAKDGADYKTCTPIATGRAKLPAKRLLDELHLIAYEREQVPIVEANIAAIVALHNAYPDLRAHIDAQAATIAGLRERMLSDAAVDAGARAHMNERRRLNGVEPISDEDWHAITGDSGLRSCMDMPFRAAIVAALNAAGAQ